MLTDAELDRLAALERRVDRIGNRYTPLPMFLISFVIVAILAGTACIAVKELWSACPGQGGAP